MRQSLNHSIVPAANVWELVQLVRSKWLLWAKITVSVSVKVYFNSAGIVDLSVIVQNINGAVVYFPREKHNFNSFRIGMRTVLNWLFTERFKIEPENIFHKG